MATDPTTPSDPKTPSSIHPDFSLPWCKAILSSPVAIMNTALNDAHTWNNTNHDGPQHNTMYLRTLATPSAIRAQLIFTRPALSKDAVVTPTSPTTPTEYCSLISIGDGVDGRAGRAHGGFNALVLDHMLGTSASMAEESVAPATATMTVDYKAPVATPGVIFVRAWVEEMNGRKVWTKGVISDGDGKELAVGKALFILARRQNL